MSTSGKCPEHQIQCQQDLFRLITMTIGRFFPNVEAEPDRTSLGLTTLHGGTVGIANTMRPAFSGML